MAIKNGWDFESSHGFTGSAGKTMVKGYARGGKIGPIKKGALHKEMGIPQGQKIPSSKLQAAKHSSNPLERKRANFAINAKKWNHAEGGPICKAEGGQIKTSAVKTGYQQSDGAGKGGPDLNVKFAGNHLAYKKGGEVMKRAKGGMTRPMGMPKAPVVGMKRMRHPPGMAGQGGGPKPMMPSVPGLPAAGSAPMGVPGKPGSPPRVMARGGKTNCGGD
jgi:hypothetical protein